MSSLRMNKTLKNRQFSPISKKSSLRIPSKRTFSENTLFSLKECPKENSTENRNKVMANKLEKKIDKIIDSINEKDSFKFNRHHSHSHHHNLNENNDPRDLLNQLKKEDDPNKKNQLIGEVCHIEAAEIGGERYNPNQSDEDRRDYSNFIGTPC